MVHDAETAEELTQEVFIKLWISRSRLVQVENLEGYIFTMTRNKTLNYFRKEANESKLLQHLQLKMKPAENNVEEQMNVVDHYQVMEEALNQLSAQRRRVFVLSRYEGMNLEEIAKQLHLSRNTIKNHLGASLRFIRTYLSKYGMILPVFLLFLLK